MTDIDIKFNNNDISWIDDVIKEHQKSNQYIKF